MDLQSHQKKAFEALQLLKQLLEERGIPYYLLAGSALGAVRHQGFIPWDDDIDVGILYRDIEEVEALLQTNPLPGFRYVSVYNDPTYPRLHGKVVYNGDCCIDIFPLVKVSDNLRIRKLQWMLRKITWKIYSRKVGYLHPKEKPAWVLISRILGLFFTRKSVLKLSDWNCRAFENRDTEYYINMFSIYKMEKELIPAKCIAECQPMPFNGESVMTLGYLDEYLTNLYGDYMTPVPVSQRTSTHTESF